MNIDLDTALKAASVLVSFGSFYGAIKIQLSRLEKKQDKHNGLIERMVVVEQATKSAHHRLDDSEEKQEENQRAILEKLDVIKDGVGQHIKEYHSKK